MTTLQTRLAQADKPSRELLEEVWEAINGPFKQDLGGGRYRVRGLRFKHMLDAEAWTSAVEMLVPEGMCWMLWGGDPNCQDSAAMGPLPARGELMEERFSADASHPALALAIACLKARGL